jgi:signal transduction histidine kinase
MSRATALRDHRVVPAVAAVALGLLGVVEAWSDPQFRPHFGVLAVASAVIAAGFAVAVRWPVAGAFVVACFYPVSSVLGAPGPGGAGLIASLVATAYAGFAASPRTSQIAVVASVGVFLATEGLRSGLSWDTVFFPAVFVPAWWVGTLVRRERERSRQVIALATELDARREASARAAVVEERARIAREVHDSVAHSVSVMTLQLGGLRRQLDAVLVDHPAERDVMLGLERLGRQSVEELRATVGLLRERGDVVDGAPPPTLARLEDLVADVRVAGLEVSLEVSGTLDGLPKALDTAAYRIVQEGLSNVLRHAPGARAVVRVGNDDNVVRLTVADDGPGSGRPGVRDRDTAAVADGTHAHGGHGIVGMRERVDMLGGTLAVGPVPGGGFEVDVRLPIRREWP